MYDLYLLLTIFIFLISYGVVEYARHQKNIYSIPIRIHINGTRGKSSVTRLTGAGLRAGGISTITKVTGTYPRLILENGKEILIYRKGPANIIEQKSIIKFASVRKVKALVIECMALQPKYQDITENKMIHSTISVITNVRADHLDVMGPGLKDVARALGNTIPAGKNLFTSDSPVPEVIKKISNKKGTVIHTADANDVSIADMTGFNYIEHKENVALALKICVHLGIKRNVALKGMHSAIPDEGALHHFRIRLSDKTINFFNAFAANDPDSTFKIWRKLDKENYFNKEKTILLNTRKDRMERSEQLIHMIREKLDNEIKQIFLVGESQETISSLAVKIGIHPSKIISVRIKDIPKIYNEILSKTGSESSVFAIGNMGGIGGRISDYFKSRSKFNHD